MIHADKIRKARQKVHEIGGHKFTIERPSELAASDLFGYKTLKQALPEYLKFVREWDLTELDVHSGGSSDPAQFDYDDLLEWFADRKELWEPFITIVRNEFNAFEKAKHERGEG